MRRREFIALMGGVAAAWPLIARAQQGNKLPVVAVLVPGTQQVWDAWIAAFVQRLAELGWSEGHNTVAINVRWAEAIAIDLLRLPPNLFASTSMSLLRRQPKRSAQRNEQHRRSRSYLRRLAIRSALVWSPAWRGRVAMLLACRTSLRILEVKQLELLREVVPRLRRLGILGDYGNRSVTLDMNAVAEFSRAAGMEVVKSEIRRAEDIVPSFAALNDQAQAMYIASGPLVDSDRGRINALAVAEGLPTMYGTREQVQAGGLMS